MITYPIPSGARSHIEINCRWCGKELNDKRRAYCGTSCRDKWINDVYLVENYKLQRSVALKRDEFKCQQCGMTRVEHKKKYRRDLHAHHIKPRVHGGSNHSSNLLTLCQDCHIEIHKILGVEIGA